MGFLDDFLAVIDPESENNPINKVKNAVVSGIDGIDNAVNASADALEGGLDKANQAADALHQTGEKVVDGINTVDKKITGN